MYEYKYTVMQPKAAKTLNHQLGITHTGNIIYHDKVSQSEYNLVYDWSLFCFSSLACLSTSIMSKGGPSMRELRLDYTIDCPTYLEW